MQFVGTSLLGSRALHRIDSPRDTEASECSMRSTQASVGTSGAGGDRESFVKVSGDVDSLAARLSNLEALVSEFAGPPVVEQIDALRKALSDECMERQLAHNGLLRSVEALGLEDVAASVSSAVMQKLTDEVRAVNAEQGAKLEVLKLSLEARMAECEAGQKQGMLEMMPLRELPGRVDALQAKLEAALNRLQAWVEQRLECHVTVQTQETAAATEQVRAYAAAESARAAAAAEHAVERAVAASDECSRSLAHLKGLIETGSLCTVARVEAIIQGKIDEVQTEWKSAMDEERISSTARTRSMGKTIGEELERNTVAQAVAEARTEACTVACNVLSKELEVWHTEKEGRCSRTELAQLAERVAVSEALLKEAVFSSTVKETKDPSYSVADDPASTRSLKETCVRLESRFGALATEVHATTTSLQTEMASVRDDMRRFASVDVLAMQTSVQKLSLQAEASRRELEQIEMHGSDAWQKEAQARAQGDQKIEKRCIEKLAEHEVQFATFKEDVKANGTLLHDILRHMGREQRPAATTSSDTASEKEDPVPAMLQGRLQSIIAKLDNKCIEDLGPDLKDLSSLLNVQMSEADAESIDLTSASLAASIQGRSPSVETSPPTQASVDSSERMPSQTRQQAWVKIGEHQKPSSLAAPHHPIEAPRLSIGTPLTHEITDAKRNSLLEQLKLGPLKSSLSPRLVQSPRVPQPGTPDTFASIVSKALSSDQERTATTSAGSDKPTSVEEDSASGTGRAGNADVQSLKDDILQYLRSEFYDQVAETIKNVQTDRQQSQPPALGAAQAAADVTQIAGLPRHSDGQPQSLRAPLSTRGPSSSMTPRQSEVGGHRQVCRLPSASRGRENPARGTPAPPSVALGANSPQLPGRALGSNASSVSRQVSAVPPQGGPREVVQVATAGPSKRSVSPPKGATPRPSNVGPGRPSYGGSMQVPAAVSYVTRR